MFAGTVASSLVRSYSANSVAKNATARYVLPLYPVVPNSCNPIGRRTIMTTTSKATTMAAVRRLMTNGGFLRVAAAATTGGVVVVMVGGGSGMMMMNSSRNSSENGGTTMEWLSSSFTAGSGWWFSNNITSSGNREPTEEEGEGTSTVSNNDDDDEARISSSAVSGEAMLATSAATSNDNDNSSLWDRFFGGGNNSSSSGAPPADKDGDDNTIQAAEADFVEDTCHSGPGKRVLVRLEEELVESLPVMSLEEVQNCTTNSQKRMLVTYEGIVYDVTQFVNDHPGGAELIKTAAGLDLDHFFGNYTIHGKTTKAAEWLAPLAIAKLSPEEAIQSRKSTTSTVHVERRGKILNKQRRKIIFVASTLPFWMTIRSVVGWIGWFVPPLGRLLAWAVPVTVPGLTKGSERLLDAQERKEEDTPYKVAVIGGGIAGCGAAWALSLSGFDVTLYEAREQISGNARTFTWDFSPYRGWGATVESCVSVTAWPPIFYKVWKIHYIGVCVEML